MRRCDVILHFGICYLKVGLGGELDATNVVQTALSILCSVCKYAIIFGIVFSSIAGSLTMTIVNTAQSLCILHLPFGFVTSDLHTFEDTINHILYILSP